MKSVGQIAAVAAWAPRLLHKVSASKMRLPVKLGVRHRACNGATQKVRDGCCKRRKEGETEKSMTI